MPNLTRNHLTVAAATAAAAIAGSQIAGAADKTASTSSPGTASTQPHRPAGAPGAGEKPLTGDTKTQVEKAALAKVPGTVIRSETDDGGVYEAHVRKADGTEAEVKVDKDFNVTAVNRFDGRGGPGGRGAGGAETAAVAKKLGVTSAKLASAVESARPARDEDGGRGGFAADLAKALGVPTAKVQSVLDANHPQGGAGRGGPGHGPGDDSALVSALANGTGKSEADVKAALDELEQARDADRSTERAAFYAAVAKALGKDAADVKAAFESVHPTR